MTVEVEGMAELRKNLAKLEVNFGKEIKDALIAGGLLVESQAKQNIQEISAGKSTVSYRAGGGKRNHITSSPGDSPNTDTGALVRSINTEIKEDSVFVGTSLDYAPSLEFGSINMAPRPFLHKALLSKQSKINGLVIKAVKGAINASTN